MAVTCTCERCGRLAKRNSVSIFRSLVFVSLFATTLPYAWLLFVAGPGVVGVLPIVMAIGFSIIALFRDWAFPQQLCAHCGASLEHAPVAQKSAPVNARPRRSMALAASSFGNMK
jgi:hypothetical protein